MRVAGLWLGLLVQLVTLPVLAQETRSPVASVEQFTPQGAARQVRQVTARFTVPIVTLGDPRLPDPFDVQCPARARDRWADPRNWVYDFDEDLPAGLRCTFTLRAQLRTAAGGRCLALAPFLSTRADPRSRPPIRATGGKRSTSSRCSCCGSTLRPRRSPSSRTRIASSKDRGADRRRSARGRGARGSSQRTSLTRLSILPAAVEKRRGDDERLRGKDLDQAEETIAVVRCKRPSARCDANAAAMERRHCDALGHRDHAGPAARIQSPSGVHRAGRVHASECARRLHSDATSRGELCIACAA